LYLGLVVVDGFGLDIHRLLTTTKTIFMFLIHSINLEMEKIEQHKKVAEIKGTYEQIALAYNRVRSKPWRECLEFIKTFDCSGWILDIGCGSGRHSLASALQGHQTVGIDFSKNMLKIAHQKLKSASPSNFHPVLADASQLPFKSDLFTHILYIATLHNLPSRSLRIRSLNEIRRVMKPGGKCLISVWKRLQSRFLSQVITTYLRKIIGMKEDFEVSVPWKINDSLVYRYFYLYSAKQLKKDINEAGMNILSFSKAKIGAHVLSDNYFVTVTKNPGREMSDII